MAQRNRLGTRLRSPNFGLKLKNLSWMAKGVSQSVTVLHLLLPSFANSFVLPNQHMQLEVYDSAPLVQFPARHSGSLQLEDWVDPAPVSDLIPVVDLAGDAEDVGEPVQVEEEEDSSSYILPVSPEKKRKKKKSKKKKDSEAGNHAKTKKQQFKDVLSKVKTKSKKSGKSKSKKKSKKSKSGKSKKSKKSRAEGKKNKGKKKTKRVEH